MKNLVLIGMPSSGKSTVGNLLALRMGAEFLDGDDLIRAAEGKPLSSVIKERGTDYFLEAEERAIDSVRGEGIVLATGGSVVYSERAMAHLKSLGLIVYLKVSLATVKRRIPDFAARGVVMRGDIKTLDELFFERVPLYEKYADETVDCEECTIEEAADRIAALAKENL